MGTDRLQRPDTWPAPETPADRRRTPNWTTGAKDGAGTSENARSRVWFTIANGVLTETFFPRIDQANTRDLRFVITADDGFRSIEGHDTQAHIDPLGDGIPAYRLTNRCHDGRYEIAKTIIADDEHAAVLQQVHFRVLDHNIKHPRLFLLLAPHLANQGQGNDGWIGDYKGAQLIFARRADHALALGCSSPIVSAECTYFGLDDAWEDLRAHGELTLNRPHAFDGNLLLAAEIGGNLDEPFLLSLAFGGSPDDAGQQARAALTQDFDNAVKSFCGGWAEFHQKCEPIAAAMGRATERAYRVSASMLRVHEDKAHSGAIIASLAIPWGEVRSDHDEGGYHLVWPRDLVESAGGLLAAGLTESGRLALLYLMSTQENSGHWPQNMWLDGSAYWHGVQLDETGLPVLLADALRRCDALGDMDPWPMVRKAASYIICNGPATPEDRWEEEAGYSPFTLAVEVAALLAAAGFAERGGEKNLARFLCETADYWNDCIERWTYVRDTELAKRLKVDGYYVRLAPPGSTQPDGAPPGAAPIALKNHPMENSRVPYGRLVSPDALALVRFGLRDAHDPRMVNTVRAIDAQLKSETATGPVWHRYTGDGYGEKEDGSAFDGTGVGRGWPLLAGERAHYEVAAGNYEEAERLRDVIMAQSSEAGLIPEQVWDAADIPDKHLFSGRPSGSAMPLVWAHAEFIKLCRSLRDRSVFDMPPGARERYVESTAPSPFVVWRRNNKRRDITKGKRLRIELLHQGSVRWHVASSERRGTDAATDSGLGVSYVDIPTEDLPAGAEVVFEVLDVSGVARSGEWRATVK